MPDVPPAQSDGILMDELARQITGAWPRFVEVWEEFRAKHRFHLRAELDANPAEFLKEALWAAYGRGHLRALLLRLQEASLTAPGIHEASKPFVGSGFYLQSYVNGQWTPQNALINGRRFIQACDHVCRISIDGKHTGTGILIRPTVVATAAHVVKRLVNPGTPPQVPSKPLDGSVGRLTVNFFHADDLLPDGAVAPAQPITGTLHQDWLAYYSPPATGEGEALYEIDSVAGIAAGAGPWDLALIRLAQPPRSGLRGYPLYGGLPPPVRFGVHVLHHPAQALGAPMGLLWSIGMMNKALGAPEPLRWLHDANTDKGSSGAPCFDNDWQIVALHQAGPSDVSLSNQNNRAVPIYRWAQQIDAIASDKDVTPYLTHAIDQNGVRMPVFDRRSLQLRAWRAMTSSSPLSPQQRIFLVLGQPDTGKTFTTSILIELAHRAGCPLASLDVRNVGNATPLDFAQQVMATVGGPLVGDVASGLGFTTQLREMRNELVPRLGQALEDVAQQRPIWLVLDGLEICDTTAQGVGQVIDGLLAAMEQFPHLHMALIGWNSAVQAEHAEVLRDPPTAADIVEHLLLTLAPPGFQTPAQTQLALQALVQTLLDQQPPGKPYARAAAAAEAASGMMRAFIAQSAATVPAEVPSL